VSSSIPCCSDRDRAFTVDDATDPRAQRPDLDHLGAEALERRAVVAVQIETSFDPERALRWFVSVLLDRWSG